MGTITNTDITYTDDISNTLDDVWAPNDLIKKHMWAQTAEPELTTQYRNVVFQKAGEAGTLKEIKIFSESSKFDTTVAGAWDNSGRTVKQITKIDKSDIFLTYGLNGLVRLGTRNLTKPLNWGWHIIDNFDLTKFLIGITVTYRTTIDNNGDFILNKNNWGTTEEARLCDYIDLKNASGLSDDEWYKRYPIIFADICCYYKKNNNTWDTLYNITNTDISLSTQFKNTASVYDSFIAYNNSLRGTSAINHNSNMLEIPTVLGISNTPLYRYNQINDDIYTSSYNIYRSAHFYEFNQSRYLNAVGYKEITIDENEKFFENDDLTKPIFKNYLTDDEKLGILVSPVHDGTKETGVFLTPYWRVEQIMKRVALFGVYFTTDHQLAGTDLSDYRNIPQKIFLGHMDDNGWTDGTYAEGTAIKNFVSANKEITNISDTPYNPDSEPQKTDDLDSDVFGTNVQYAKFSKKYLITDTDMTALYNEIKSSADFAAKDGMQYFVSLQKIPQIFAETCIVSDENVTFGDWTSSLVDAGLIEYTTSEVIIDSITVPKRYNNFLDYYPYTRHKMYLPYVGTVDLPPDLAGKKLNVRYSWDLENGNCTAYISVVTDNNLSVFAAYSGNIYGDITVTANNANIKQIKQALSLASGVTGIISAGTTLNPLSVINSTINTLQTAVDTETKGFFHTKTSQGDFNNFVAPQTCKLITQYMYVDDFTPFEKSTGYNCSKWAKLSDMHGHTVVQNANIGSSFMTISEVEELNSLLENGVDLP